MQFKIKKPVKWIFAILLPVIFLALYARNPMSNAKPVERVPHFTLQTLEGEEITFEQLKGKVLLINFWATWCGPCRSEIPDFVKMYDSHRKDGLEILGIVLNSGSIDEVRQFVKTNAINYPILTGNDAYKTALTKKFGGVRGIPTTFLVDRNGKIQKKWVGARGAKEFMKEIDKYL